MVGPPEAPGVPLPAARAAPDGPLSEPDATVRFFLIADVRGYTSFTQRQGDEAAARLAGRFAAITREVVSLHSGVLLELRGDEALVFGSARPAIRAALALQQRFIDETLADPGLPMAVGIGLDAGEAVAVEGGYRGGALNLAARLCSQAEPGDVLASQEVTHLARRLDGVDYRPRGRVALKGLAQPVPMVQVLPTKRDEARLAKFRSAVAGPRKRRFSMRMLVAVAVVAVLLAGTAVYAVSNDTGPVDVLSSEDRADVVDLGSGEVIDQVLLRRRPAGVAAGAGALWTTNPGDGSVSRLDRGHDRS